MTGSQKFPPTVEIKRVIAAAQRAGIEIGRVEIHPGKITIHPRDKSDTRTDSERAYDEWKAQDLRRQSRKQSAEETDAFTGKSKR